MSEMRSEEPKEEYTWFDYMGISEAEWIERQRMGEIPNYRIEKFSGE